MSENTNDMNSDPILEAARLIKCGTAVGNNIPDDYTLEWLDPEVRNFFVCNVRVVYHKHSSNLDGVDRASADARWLAETMLTVIRHHQPDYDWFISDEPDWYDAEGNLVIAPNGNYEDEDLVRQVDTVQYHICREDGDGC